MAEEEPSQSSGRARRTGKSGSLGSRLKRASATSGRRWYDSTSAVESRCTASRSSQLRAAVFYTPESRCCSYIVEIL